MREPSEEPPTIPARCASPLVGARSERAVAETPQRCRTHSRYLARTAEVAMDSDALTRALRAFIGRPGAPEIARDAVSQPMIRHWCDAMEDANPAYLDAAFAARSVHGAIVAPPAMLNAWTMPGLPGRPAGRVDPAGEVYRALDAAGFTSVVATDSAHEYVRYLRLGDLVHGVGEVQEVSDEKKTGLGAGHFVTTQTTYTTQTGEVVGRMRFRILKFKPGTGRAASGAFPEPAARELPPRAPRREATLRAGGVKLGDALSPCAVPITATLIVSAAIASRDYQDVHHDRELAKLRGSPDIFMNILTTSGLVARYVTDWAGPEGLLRRLAIRLGAPNYPGDAMVLSGNVSAANEREVEIALRGDNRLGPHVTGTVALTLAP
jgi:acyl dehydratase